MSGGRRLLSTTEADYLRALGIAVRKAPNGEERNRVVEQVVLATRLRRLDGVSWLALAQAVGCTVATLRKWRRIAADPKPPAAGLLGRLDRTALDPSRLWAVTSHPGATALIAIVTGHDDGAGHRLHQEARDVMDLLEPLGVHVRLEPAASLAAVVRCLERHRPRVVHVAGRHAHGGVLLAAGMSPSPTLWDDVADAFRRSGAPPQLAVLNVCDSINGAIASLAAGVRLIVGCRATITDDIALTFSGTFYAALRGRSVRAAFEDAVAALAPQDRHRYELRGSERAMTSVIVR